MGIILGRSVQGFSHIRAEKPCQDWHETIQIKTPAATYDIIAVADGHGSLSCPYSDDGSRLATRVFCDLLSQYSYAYDTAENLRLFLNEKKPELASKIVEMWSTKVQKFHTDKGREPPTGIDDRQTILRKYGTTLLGLLIAPTFVYAFQIGDGNIVYVDPDGTEPLLEGDETLGVETWSMSSKDAWKKSHSKVINFATPQNQSHMYMLSTDGFANSYSTDNDFYLTCQAYFNEFMEHRDREVAQNLTNWLNETSEKGCGDDITAVFAFYEDAPKAGNNELDKSGENVEHSEEDANDEKHSSEATPSASKGYENPEEETSGLGAPEGFSEK